MLPRVAASASRHAAANDRIARAVLGERPGVGVARGDAATRSPRVYAPAMRGAVAAGNKHTAEAGAWALREGGTCVDAALAAVFAAFVTEGPLTGPCGGGFVLLCEPGAAVTLLDCFFAVPSRARAEMDEIEIDFADASTQLFHIGEASVAVPGLLPGLHDAHERRGRLPWSSLFVPALEIAARPLATTKEQAFLHEILVPILQREEGGRRIYGDSGRIDAADVVPALQLLRDAGPEAVALLLPELADDLGRYRVEERSPLEGTFVGMSVLTTPAPSRGGTIVQRGLASLEAHERGAPGSAEEALALVAALAAAYGPDGLAAGTRPTGTTHVSVVDGDGAALGLSSTLGSGSGVFRHGFQLNTMLGELDVIGDEEHEAGSRLPSMMTPTVVLDEDGAPRLTAGSAGSVRLAGAILQVVEGVVAQQLPVAEAIARPRLHVDGETAHVEGGWSDEVAAALAEAGLDVRRWSDRNLFFGGVSAVERRRDGRLGAAGDPRRGGHGVSVP
jgi:gamma-glutamyltranspeptidase/glutathione hydrolase